MWERDGDSDREPKSEREREQGERECAVLKFCTKEMPLNCKTRRINKCTNAKPKQNTQKVA